MANPDCAILIKQINDALFKRANKHLAASGLTLSQMRLQQLLIEVPGQSMSFKEVEHRLHVAQSTTVGLIGRLEKKGLVKTWTDKSDRRTKMVCLTEEGEECCQKAASFMAEDEDWLTEGMDEKEIAELYRLLSHINHHLESL